MQSSTHVPPWRLLPFSHSAHTPGAEHRLQFVAHASHTRPVAPVPTATRPAGHSSTQSPFERYRSSAHVTHVLPSVHDAQCASHATQVRPTVPPVPTP